jgi:hypothetical protein
MPGLWRMARVACARGLLGLSSRLCSLARAQDRREIVVNGTRGRSATLQALKPQVAGPAPEGPLLV